jgi:hypothetical protein
MLGHVPPSDNNNPSPAIQKPHKRPHSQTLPILPVTIEHTSGSKPMPPTSVFEPDSLNKQLKAMSSSDPSILSIQREELEIDQASIPSAHNWAQVSGEGRMKRLRVIEEGSKPLRERLENNENVQRNLDNADTQVGLAAQDIQSTHWDNVAEKLGDVAEGVGVISVLGNGASLYFNGAVIDEAKKERDIAAAQLGTDHPNVKAMDSFIEKKTLKQNSAISSYLLDAALLTPKIARSVVSYIASVSSRVLTGLDWGSSIASVLSSGVEVLRATNALVVTKLGSKVMKQEVKGYISVDKGELGPDGVKQNVVMRPKDDGVVTPIDKLLQKRKAEYDLKRVDFMTKYEPMVATDSKVSYLDTLRELHHLGIDLELIKADLDVPTANALKDALSEKNVNKLHAVLRDDKVKERIFKENFGKREGLAKVSATIVKSLAAKKLKLNAFFDKYRLTKGNINFSLATICATAFVVTKVVALTTAIVLPSVILSATGFGAIGVGVILMGVGLYYFYKKKPNLMRTVLKMVHIRLSLDQLPKAIRNFQHKRALLKESENTLVISKIKEMQDSLGSIISQRNLPKESMLPKELRSFYKAVRTKLNALNNEGKTITEKMEAINILLNKELSKRTAETHKIVQEVKETEKRLQFWEQKVQALQDEIVSANYQDLLREVGDDYISKLRVHKTNVQFENEIEAILASIDGKEPKPVDTAYFDKLLNFRISNIIRDLAHGLLYDPDMLNKEDKQFFTKVLKLDLEEFKNIPNKAEAEDKLVDALTRLFGADEEAVTKLNQRLIEQAGLA